MTASWGLLSLIVLTFPNSFILQSGVTFFTLYQHFEKSLEAHALILSTAGAPEASLWISSGPPAFSADRKKTSNGLEGLRVGANVLHKWAKGFSTRLQLSADALAAAALGETDTQRDFFAGSSTSSQKGRSWASSGSSFLMRLCEALEVTGEAAAEGSARRLRTVVRFDLPSGRSRIFCAAADGSHEVLGEFSPLHGTNAATASLASSHLFRRGDRFLKIQPSHNFSSKTSQLRILGGTIPQQKTDTQWTEVDVHITREHPTNTWDAVIGLRQVFDGGKVSFAPFLRLKDRRLRYEYKQRLPGGGTLSAVLDPSQQLSVQWRDPSTAGGHWLAQADLPLHKGSEGWKEGSVIFRREWFF